MQFICQFLPGDRPELATDFEAWTPDDDKVFAEHYARLERATEEGIVVLAGRSQDGVGPAIVIFGAESEEEALRFMRDDPFIKHGLFTATLHPFRVAFARPADD